MTALFFVLFFGTMLLLGMPLFASITVTVAAMPLFFAGNCGFTLANLGTWMMNGSLSSVGITILLFILAGDVMARGKLTEKLFDTFAYYLGKKRGFMPIISVLTCMFYGAISGSGPATTAAVGAMCFPLLKKMGYDTRFSACLLVAAGCLGMVIPPSAPLTTAAGLTEAFDPSLDVVVLYKMAAPVGILAGLILIVYAYLYCRKHGNGDQAVIDAHNDALRSRPFSAVLKESIWALLCPVIILGGIFAGITDTSQAAAISLIYAIFVSVWIYKSVTLSEVVEIIKGSLSSAAPLCILLAIANIFSGALGAMKVPDQMAETLVNAGFPHMLLVGLLLLVMLVLGTFMDSGAAMRILVPLVYPVLLRLGMEPYSFVVAVIMTQAIGLTTPPYGLCLFVMAPVSGESMTSLSKGIIPLVLTLIAVAYLFGLFPGLLGWALPG